MVQVRGKGGDKFLPGRPYSLLVGVQWGTSSWVDPIEARHTRRLADSPKPSQPGSGRPKGSRNRPKAKRPPYRATDKPDKTGPEEITRAA
ncbi:MAG: hypothetical protein JWN00_6169 [Actinomycetia bacterium]|nr:hypothetical protein [Actinomycetes bacterium]